jgi:hypothetical protein
MSRFVSMFQRTLSLPLLALPLLAAPLHMGLAAQDPAHRVFGAQIHVLQGAEPDLRGELLASDMERLWMLDREHGFVEVGFAGVEQIRIQRHGVTARTVTRWTLVAGGLTSAAMLGACLSVDDSNGECLAFTAVWALAWAAVGGLSGLVMRPSRRIGPGEVQELRPYARFPQGIPEGWIPGDSGGLAPNPVRR